MNQTQADFVVGEIKEEIQEIKSKAEKGERPTRDEYSELCGQVFMLWRLDIISMKEWEAMCNEISFAYCGVRREV